MQACPKSNACSACARSKRKCGRQIPLCAQCACRGRTCVYPLSKVRAASSSRPLLSAASRGLLPRVEDELLAEIAVSTAFRNPNPPFTDDLMLDIALPVTDNDFSAPASLIQTFSTPPTGTDWFLAPETWRISYRLDNPAVMPIGIATMKKYVAVLQSWFQCWVTTGSNPFVHSCLYSEKTPGCVQVAYATLASYIYRTPANADFVLQIVEDRSNDLLRENGAILERVGAEKWIEGREQDIDLFAQLTRLHALMVYQIIGLFDGDIRSRYIAEGHMAVQDSWAGKLFHSAAKGLSTTHSVAAHLVGCLPTPSTYSQQQWYLWILSESIRRTWLVAVSISSVFSALQKQWAACPGSIMYTNRSGLWKAASATEWERQCSEGNIAFLQRFECAKLFDDLKPGDIDEFGTAMLDMTFSGELIEKWRDKSSSL